MENNGLMIIALVAVVSVVGLVMLSAGSTGANMIYVSSGEEAYRFDRPLGANSADYSGATNSQCYRGVDGGMFCDSAPIER